ncbi:AAA domain-containing protein [Methylosarcina fibrata]|uniref:AAA domain-containing protein n=1 Tax=Methylosarcina fibrata TaxID=105972 RepID=UPI00037F3FB1|nr:AAA domain-containing protein [Methylosarcina fibrata]
MSIQHERLRSLIEFVQSSARLRSRLVTDVAQHNLFHAHENEIACLPGLHFAESEGDAWLRVERLQEIPPPPPESGLLQAWLDLSPHPGREPELRRQIATNSPTPAGAVPVSGDGPAAVAAEIVFLEACDLRSQVEAEFKVYFETVWKPWAVVEKQRRRTMSLYAQLFTLKQRLEGAIADSPVELVWGVGHALWREAGAQLSYPLLTQPVELILNERTMAIEIRPREVDPGIELDFFAAANKPGVPALEKAAAEFFKEPPAVFSPWDPGSFEPLLRTAVTHLDPSGSYWPGQTAAEDRSLPPADDRLKVTDTWVLFARPRNASLLIQDLERFKAAIDDIGTLPPALFALLSDPSGENPEIFLPAFRGLSMIQGSGGEIRDLFFPAAFNDEQVQIVQKLQAYDGVVVQGPPGTGKTHTIGNIICHCLALGQRVLVTSMKEPALTVLKEKLPERIRPLAVSLLTAERDGMKQFEYSIAKIASEIQGIDRLATAREIDRIDAAIGNCHARLARIDAGIGALAANHLGPFELDGELVEPRDAAAEVSAARSSVIRLDDAVSISPEFRPRFTDADMSKLREARRTLGQDLEYLGVGLPQMAAFPDSRELLRAHQDLSRCAELKSQVDNGRVSALADASEATLAAAEQLYREIEELQALRKSVADSALPWTEAMLRALRDDPDNELLSLFSDLADGFDAEFAGRRRFLAKPVELGSDGDDRNEVLLGAIQRSAEGKSPFGITDLLGKNAEKASLKAIRVDGHPPAGNEDWRHALDFVRHRRALRTLLTRWNNLALEFRLPQLAVEPAQAPVLSERLGHYRSLKTIVSLESRVAGAAKRVSPSWSHAETAALTDEILGELQQWLSHHLMQNRLAGAWAMKERCQQWLHGCGGGITEALRGFVERTLGDPAVAEADLQAQWSALLEELRRIHGLKPLLDTVESGARLIGESGAPRWAERLKTKPAGETDPLLPEDWRKVWRINRLANHLEQIDGRDELKRLAGMRTELESELGRAYQDAVALRTWLNLAENASPGVKAALQAYLAAVVKIGKGKGKRAPMYQRQARHAAMLASPAIPCWIMPHHRISESLPAEFGSFDLVIIDEASQSDLSALPAIFRANQILVVGDDKQVSPEGAFLDSQSIQNLTQRFLSNHYLLYRDQMGPDRSIYDLFKVVFAASATMLKEHFRCVAPIIEYSKREVYRHELKPLRLPKASERLDPPLIDVFVEDGIRLPNDDVNPGEAHFIVEEIKAIVENPEMAHRSIGVVSLLGDKQALRIWEMLNDDDLDADGRPQGLSPELIDRHRITCGDARTFQGKERDIMFLSMVVSRGNASALARDTFAQRFNVAASRARDRMYLVRSIAPDDLSPADKLRRHLIDHFAKPFAREERPVKNPEDLCESDFERELYDFLTGRGYRVLPRVQFGGQDSGAHEFRIDLVVEGNGDNRLAIGCDGDRLHGAERWDDEMRRQRILERAGWRFWRCFAATFLMNREAVLADLLETLTALGIEPGGKDEGGPGLYSEHRRYLAFPHETASLADGKLPSGDAA